MRKVPTLFVRDENDRRYVTPEVTPGCEWVLAGEGTPTRKFDGTCVMFDGTDWWARREVKPGKVAPPNFVALSTDETTGKTVGWEPVEQSGFAKWHAEAVNVNPFYTPEPGTYELIGPKINGNPEHRDSHGLVPHGVQVLSCGDDRSFESLRLYLTGAPFGYEGIVWHHPDGRMAKLKVRDFPKAKAEVEG